MGVEPFEIISDEELLAQKEKNFRIFFPIEYSFPCDFIFEDFTPEIKFEIKKKREVTPKIISFKKQETPKNTLF